jgi:hypothetical protein
MRDVGASTVVTEDQVFVVGLYLAPLLNLETLVPPPQTIISEPVHTAV